MELSKSDLQALCLSETCCHKNGTRPLSLLCLDKQLYIPSFNSITLLTSCSATYKCGGKFGNFVASECRWGDNGRCSHYYEIQEAREELDQEEYYEYEDKDRLIDLKVKYERALAAKEDRLQEYLDDLYDFN